MAPKVPGFKAVHSRKNSFASVVVFNHLFRFQGVLAPEVPRLAVHFSILKNNFSLVRYFHIYLSHVASRYNTPSKIRKDFARW
jgi:hypothetical protein